MIWLHNGNNTKKWIRNTLRVGAFGTHETTEIVIVKELLLTKWCKQQLASWHMVIITDQMLTTRIHSLFTPGPIRSPERIGQ